ncbi:MAG: adenosine-specific kinase [Candidatus Aenigmatarchaeota archaeon]
MKSVKKFEVIQIEIPKDANVIIGQAHFIKTVEDLYEALMNSLPSIKFGIAFCEASGKRLIRFDGNDEELINLAVEHAKAIGAGHTFIIYIRNAYPINVLKYIKEVPEVVRIFAATANPLQVIVAETEQGRGIIGVIDGYTPLGIEDEENKKERHEFLRKIGYKR